MDNRQLKIGPLGRKVGDEVIAIVDIIMKAGLTVGQTRVALRDVEALIEETPVLVPILQKFPQG